MGANSAIEWTDHTFNGWMGCEKVSEACKHCYAEQVTPVRAHRARGLELWGKDGARQVTVDSNWKQLGKWNCEAAADGVRKKVFAFSLADVFEDRRDLDAPRARFFAAVERCPSLDFLVLTKRTDRVLDLVPPSWRGGFPPNWWQGTTVENQQRANERILHLVRVPAVVRFLSMEPLLGPVDLGMTEAGDVLSQCDDCGDTARDPLDAGEVCGACQGLGRIHWVIVGGESGTNARIFDFAHARAILDECVAAGAAFFLKQAGAIALDSDNNGLAPLNIRDKKGGDPAEWPEDCRVREFPTVAR